ncbi:LOW QUALITY PROTEIN: apolipoprotein A-II [Hippocampus zosterae]|uniref:LOW QUALITY PROTEIN: apolipoprotein A-II n=1 Tax=Hippocampus zosterae TaxID=109293 RepID=UPI00223D4327|nr:LOW QUALITY PROTEIN: apolipoprotein A-II [Hippocampus zosterae]
MNTKFAIALILALQVSMSLCDVPQPEQELVDKYNSLKGAFYQRLVNAYGKVYAAAAPVISEVGQTAQGQEAKELMESLQDKPQLQAIIKVGSGLVEEFSPLVDKARKSALGVYGHYLRPYIGQYLDNAIKNIRVHLDTFLPAQ